MKGIVEGFLGFESFDLGIFRRVAQNFRKYFSNVSIFRVISFNAFWKFLWLGNSE